MSTIAQLEVLIAGRANAGDNTTESERTLWRALRNEACKLFEVKEIDVNLSLYPTYIADNFNSTGLGINSMVGFAICNGNNGTRNRNGLTAVGYGEAYPTIGATGGEEEHILTVQELASHTHTTTYSVEDANNSGSTRTWLQSAAGTTNKVSSAVGENAPHNNMQPYIVTLMIQRIA